MAQEGRQEEPLDRDEGVLLELLTLEQERGYTY